MKYYRRSVLILSAAMALSLGVIATEQISAQQKAAQKSDMKSVGDMSMGGMMKQCHEHHDAMAKNLDEAAKALDSAKQSNDAGKMRTGIDQAQKQLADMKEHMSMCGNMMNMMEKMGGMGGMGGMMKGESK